MSVTEGSVDYTGQMERNNDINEEIVELVNRSQLSYVNCHMQQTTRKLWAVEQLLSQQTWFLLMWAMRNLHITPMRTTMCSMFSWTMMLTRSETLILGIVNFKRSPCMVLCVVATTHQNGTRSLLTSAKLLVGYLVVGITRELDKEPLLYWSSIYTTDF